VTDEFEGKMSGCRWITGWHRKYKNKAPEFCGKIPVKGSEHCPKHVLFAEHESKAPERRKTEMLAQKAHEEAMEETLSKSPLRAENPAFSEKRTPMRRRE
jgi:hypothetical protein